jgi:hypothetical protein
MMIPGRKRPRAKKKVYMAADMCETEASTHVAFEMVERSTYELVVGDNGFELLKERYSCLLEPTNEFVAQRHISAAAFSAHLAALAAVDSATAAASAVSQAEAKVSGAVYNAVSASIGAASAAEKIAGAIDGSIRKAVTAWAMGSAAQIATNAAAAGTQLARTAWLMLTERDFQLEVYERNHAAEAIQSQVRPLPTVCSISYYILRQMRRRQAQRQLKETIKRVEVVARMRVAQNRKEDKRLQQLRGQDAQAQQQADAKQEVARRQKGAAARAMWKRAQKHAKAEVDGRLQTAKQRSQHRRKHKKKEAGDAIVSAAAAFARSYLAHNLRVACSINRCE